MRENGQVCRFAQASLPRELAADAHVRRTATALAVHPFELVPPLSSDPLALETTSGLTEEDKQEARAWLHHIKNTAVVLPDRLVPPSGSECPLLKAWALGARLRPLQQFVRAASCAGGPGLVWQWRALVVQPQALPSAPCDGAASGASGASASGASVRLHCEELTLCCGGITFFPGIMRTVPPQTAIGTRAVLVIPSRTHWHVPTSESHHCSHSLRYASRVNLACIKMLPKHGARQL